MRQDFLQERPWKFLKRSNRVPSHGRRWGTLVRPKFRRARSPGVGALEGKSMRASRATYGGAQFIRRWPDLGLPRRGAAGDSLVRGGGIPAAMGWCGLAWELCRKEGELLVKSDWIEWWW